MRKFKLFLTLLTLVILGSGQMWGAGAISVTSSAIILPKGSTTVSQGDWISAANVTKAGNSWAYSDFTGDKTIGSYGSITFSNAADFNQADLLQFQKQGGYIETTISSPAGVDVVIGYKVGGNSFTVSLDGATDNVTGNSTSWSTMSISTTNTSAKLKIIKDTKNAGYVSYIQITPKASAASCSTNPTVGNIMNNVSSITASGATFTTSAGVSAGTNCSLTEVGFVYGTSTGPTITSGTKAVIANYESGNLSKTVTGLTEGTHYYVRAFATNGHGTAYSDEKEFDTPELAKYTVSFSTGAGNSAVASKTETSVGGGITLPGGPASIKASGWTFAGWAESAVSEETTTEPTLLTGIYHPTHDCSLYAVYRKTSDEYSTKTVDLVANAGTFSTDHITFSALNGTLTLTQIKATASSDVNGTYKEKGIDSNRPRVYKGQSLKIESTNYMISKVEITANSTKYGNDITAATSIESDGSVTDDTDAITKTLNYTSGGTHTFTIVDEDGVSGVYIQNTAATTNVQLHLNNVVVSYLVAEVIYYSTPCQKLPTITPSVQDATQSGITVKWTNSSDVTTWNVQYKVQGAADNTYADVTTSSKTTSDGFNLWTVTGLNAGTTYTFKIEATAFGAGVCTDVNTWTIDGATENNYVVTVESNNDNWGTAELSGSTITASPKDGYRVSKTTPFERDDDEAVDVEQDGNVFTISNLSNSCTITINFEAIPTYAVNWYVNGVPQKEEETYLEGTLVSTIMADAPEVADNALNASCGSTKFIGWVTAEYTANDGTETTYNNNKVDGEETLSAAANYYAMFATATTDEWNRVDALNAITAGTYVIVSKAADNDYYMLPNATNTSSAQAVSDDYKVTRNNDGSKITSTVPAGAEWSFTINNQSKYIIKNAEDKYLYATNTNNGLRVGSTEDTWTISVNGSAPAFLMTEYNNTRCCGIYGSQDWRCYANTEQGLGNYPDGGKVYLYKHNINYAEYRTGCECNTVTVAIGTHDNGTLKLDGGDANVSHGTCTASSVEVRVAPNTTYQFAATNAVTFNMGTTGLTAPSSYETDGDARVYTVSIPKGTAAGTITVSASFEQLPSYDIDLSGITLATATSDPSGEALGGATVTLSYSNLTSGYTFLGWSVVGDDSGDPVAVTNNQFTMPNENVTVSANIVPNVTVTFYVGNDTYDEPAVTYQGGTISLPATDPTESFDATNYPNFIGWSATNFGAATSAPALVDGSETIDASTSYYAVFGNAQTAETNKYAKVNALESGKNYLIVAEYNSKLEALHAAELNKEYWLKSGEVTATNDVITSNDAEQKWQITVEAGVAHVYNAQNEKYLGVNYVSDGGHYNARIFDNECDLTIAANAGAWNISGVSNTKTVYVIHAPSYAEFIGDDEAGAIYLYKQILASTKWATKQIAEVTVSFNDNVAEEEITVPGNQVVDSGDDLDLSGFTPGTRAGYQFAGWSLTTDGAVVASLSNITENTPLYAIWTANPNCTIKFSVRETVKDALQETILQGQTFSGFASKEIAEADEVDGYDFIGWASAAQLAETTDAITPMTSYTPEVEESASEITVYALYKRISAGADVTDEITAAKLAASTSQYTAFTDKEITSNARYAGKTSKNNGIQMNATSPNAIVSTTSGGVLKSISIEWNSNCADDRVLDVYVNNSAYTESANLWNNSAAIKGTKITNFTNDGESATSYTFTTDYAYIGVRSNTSALNLDKISITWSSSTTYYTTRPTQLWAVDYDLNGGAWKSGEGCADGTVQEGEYTVCTDVPVNGDDKLFDKWQINGVDVTTATVNITEATTFTAVWKDRGHGTVTYSANGGVVSGSAPAVADVWEAEKVTVVANTFFTNPGYSFGGWDITYNDGVNVQTITLDANNQFDMPAYDVTIAAVWSRKSTDKWTRVTSTDQLVAGKKYVIANVDATYAMSEQRTNNRGAIAVDQVGDARFITISDNVVQLTLGGNATDGWTFQEGTDYLQATNQDKNYLYTAAANGNYSKWTIAFSVDDNSNPITTVTAKSEGRNILRYNPNNDNPIFSCYASNSSVQNPVNLYMKAPKVDVTTEVDASVITAEGTDVTVKKGGILNIDAEKSVGDVHVENGGQMALTQNMEAHDLYLEAKAGQSAQVSGVDKMTLSGNVYIDIQLCNGSLDANYWYSIAVPFDVNLNDGVFLADGTQLTNRSDFEVWGYNTALRAQTQSNGWERVKDNMMHAGKAYLIGFNPGQPNVIRLKAAEGWQVRLFSDDELSVVSTGGSGDHDNWNGLANPTMRYIGVNTETSVFNNNTHGWDSYDPAALDFNFVVGTAFFVQSADAVAITKDDESHEAYRAPKRVDENKCAYAVRITREDATDFDNQIIVRASEEATGEYTQGHDMLTMNGTSSNTAALLWTENYGGKRLAIEEAAWLNGTATYELKMYAPKAGSYSISVAETKDNADLYLTYEGSIIWNLSMGAYEIELAKGATNGYGLLLQAKAPQVVTGVDEVDAETGVQKIIIDEHVFILRGGQMYDVTGKTVK